MVYFLSTIDPSFTRSGLEKRCHMWWHLWLKEKGDVQWVRLPEQWCTGSRLNRLLLTLFSFERLPRAVQLFLFFSGSPIRWLFVHNSLLIRTLSRKLQPTDVVFIFRAYNVYYLPASTISRLLGSSNQLVIDFDESDYQSLNTFGNKPLYWSQVETHIRQREQLLLSLPNVTYYVSGNNELDKLNTQYRPVSPIRVMNNKLTISPAFQPKSLTTPLRLLLIGTYTYEPNLDMIRLLLADVLPTLSTPQAYEFHIVGHGLPTAVTEQLRQYNCVVVHGGVSDDVLIHLYSRVHLSLSLLRFGGGTKYKLVEAMAYGLPIIATTASVEGLSIEPMKHYIPTTSRNFESSLRLLTQSLYSQMQLACYSAYNQHYRFDPVD